MIGSTYWDTSAILKLYAKEADSATYRQLFLSLPEDKEVAVSFLHETELFYALKRKESMGQLKEGEAAKTFKRFEVDIEQGLILQIPWGKDVSSESRNIQEICYKRDPSSVVRSLDGLHLAAMRIAKIPNLVTTDLRMQKAAIILGHKVLIPEDF